MHKLWFKRKRYGWGWTPCSWEGWVVTGVYVALIVLCISALRGASSPREVAFLFLLPFLFLTITFIRIAYKKGESPKWQWGGDRSES